jgi:hypothetical protein
MALKDGSAAFVNLAEGDGSHAGALKAEAEAPNAAEEVDDMQARPLSRDVSAEHSAHMALGTDARPESNAVVGKSDRREHHPPPVILLRHVVHAVALLLSLLSAPLGAKFLTLVQTNHVYLLCLA